MSKECIEDKCCPFVPLIKVFTTTTPKKKAIELQKIWDLSPTTTDA